MENRGTREGEGRAVSTCRGIEVAITPADGIRFYDIFELIFDMIINDILFGFPQAKVMEVKVMIIFVC